jgi:hypothetical protein
MFSRTIRPRAAFNAESSLSLTLIEVEYDLGAKRAENYAEELEWEAGVAIASPF